jgi:hypothetical protein
MPILFQVSSQVLDVAHLSCRDEFFVSPLVYIFKVSDSFHFERISFHLFFLTLRASAWGTWDLCQLYSRCLRWTYFAESNRKCLVPTSSQALFYIVGETGAKWNTGWSETVEFWYEKLVQKIQIVDGIWETGFSFMGVNFITIVEIVFKLS